LVVDPGVPEGCVGWFVGLSPFAIVDHLRIDPRPWKVCFSFGMWGSVFLRSGTYHHVHIPNLVHNTRFWVRRSTLNSILILSCTLAPGFKGFIIILHCSALHFCHTHTTILPSIPFPLVHYNSLILSQFSSSIQGLAMYLASPDIGQPFVWILRLIFKPKLSFSAQELPIPHQPSPECSCVGNGRGFHTPQGLGVGVGVRVGSCLDPHTPVPLNRG